MLAKDESFRQKVLTGNLWTVIPQVCLPLALYHGLQQIFKLLDTLMASHISSEAVSAVAFISQVTIMLSAIGNGHATGGRVKISSAHGSGDYDDVSPQTITLAALSVAIGGFFVLLGLLIVGQ